MMHLVSCLSLRTWHNMIIILQHTRVMNIAVLDVYGFQTCFGSAASAFENVELAYIHCALKECFSVTLKGYTCFTDLSRTTCALGRNYKHKVWDSKRLGNWKVRVVKGIFVTRDQRFFFPAKCEMANFFLVNRDFYSSREAWFCKIIFRETRNKCLIRHEPWFSLCLCYFWQPLLRNKWYCVTWKDGWSLLRQGGWVQQGGKLVVVS